MAESLQSLAARTAATYIPAETRKLMMPTSLVDPELDFKLTQIDVADDDGYSIFNVDPRTTMEIIAYVARTVLRSDLPTDIPPRWTDVNVQMARELTSEPTHDFGRFWRVASRHWPYADQGNSQFKILRSLLSMLYGIELTDTYSFRYILSSHGIVRVCDENTHLTKLNGYDFDMTTASLFMLVTAFIDMRPEVHEFSTSCKCIVCMYSPEYANMLNPPSPYYYPVAYPVADDALRFVFIDIDDIDTYVNTLVICREALLVYKEGRVVKITDEYYVDDIIGRLDRNLSGFLVLTDDHVHLTIHYYMTVFNMQSIVPISDERVGSRTLHVVALVS